MLENQDDYIASIDKLFESVDEKKYKNLNIQSPVVTTINDIDAGSIEARPITNEEMIRSQANCELD